MAIAFTIGVLSGSGQTIASVERPTPDLQAPSSLVAPGRTVMRDTDGLFRIEARLNGQRVRMVLDTGANVTVLTARDAARIGITTKHLHFDEALQSGGGRVAIARVRLTDAYVLDRDISGASVVVARGGFPVSVIGQDLLARLGPIAIDANQLMIDPISRNARKTGQTTRS
jgi:aspartyl protease family protein